MPWAEGGTTDIDNLTLLCGYHHRQFARRDWTVTMIEGLPAWIAPRWIDPTQSPTVHYRIRFDARYLKRMRT